MMTFTQVVKLSPRPTLPKHPLTLSHHLRNAVLGMVGEDLKGLGMVGEDLKGPEALSGTVRSAPGPGVATRLISQQLASFPRDHRYQVEKPLPTLKPLLGMIDRNHHG